MPSSTTLGSTLDSGQRLELAKQINGRISDQLPALGLLCRIDLMLIAHDLDVSAEYGLRDAAEWEVRERGFRSRSGP